MRKTCWNIGEEDKGCLLEFAVGKYALLASPINSSCESKCRSISSLESSLCPFPPPPCHVPVSSVPQFIQASG